MKVSSPRSSGCVKVANYSQRGCMDRRIGWVYTMSTGSSFGVSILHSVRFLRQTCDVLFSISIEPGRLS